MVKKRTDLDVQSLRIFEAAACGSLSLAALRMEITRSAVSQAIAQAADPGLEAKMRAWPRPSTIAQEYKSGKGNPVMTPRTTSDLLTGH